MEGDAAVTFEPLTHTFTFKYVDDLILSGSDYSNYLIQVTGEAGAVEKVEGIIIFYMVLHNPCINPQYVTVVQNHMKEYDYCLYDDAPLGH